MDQELIVAKTYGEIMNTIELKILKEVMEQNMPDNISGALDNVLYSNIENIKKYSEFKNFVFGYVGYYRKTFMNKNVTKELFDKIKIIAKYYDSKKQEQIISYVSMLEDDIYKDWENNNFGTKNDMSNKINGEISEQTGYILDQKV